MKRILAAKAAGHAGLLVLCSTLPCLPANATGAATLPAVVVTAARLPQPAAEALADVRVIEEEEIRRAGPMTLTELLQLHGGAEISANGGPGQVSGVFLRGTNTNHVVLLIDGVRVNSSTVGTNAFENIPLEQIERIEVVRGPASSLYGADAIGGVIQVFTHKGAGTRARIGAGRWDTREASAGFGTTLGPTRVTLTAGWRGSDSFSATNASHPFSFDPDDDAYRNVNVGFNVSNEWAAGHAVAMRGLLSDGRTHFDSGPGSDDVNRQRISSLALESRNRITPGWNSLLRVARGADHITVTGAFPGTFDTDQMQLGWQNDVDAFGGRIAAGVELRREEVDSSVAYTTKSRVTRSGFAGWSTTPGPHLLHVSARHDDDTQFGSRNTGRAGYGFRFADAWRISAAAGTAFKAPSFNDLYFPPTFGFSGNPNLRPERSRSFEASLRRDGATFSTGLTVFRSRISDLIAADSTFSTVINVNRARIRGATLDAAWRSGIWSARAEWTHQDAEDKGTVVDRRLARRARNYGSGSLAVAPGPWRFGVDLAGSGARFDALSNVAASRMGGYTLVHLHARYALTPRWAVSGRLNNATDKSFELAQGYNTPRRNAFVALEYASH